MLLFVENLNNNSILLLFSFDISKVTCEDHSKVL